MKTLGLTGGIGMGKSTADRMLRDRGIPVVDTDVLARDIVQSGQPALEEIRQAFGPEILSPTGELRRDLLAQRVFADDAARKQLESILHPRIRALWRAQVESWRPQNHPLAVVVIPLLFETGAERELDITLCVACSSKTQKERLHQRGWSEREIEQRIQAQFPIAKKMELATYVLWNEGSFALVEQQLTHILSNLGGD